MQPPYAALDNAFQLLTATVREFEATSRPCLGATLRPKLFSRGFNDKLFGFNKFGDFLRAAQTAGHVDLRTTPGGDIQITRRISGNPRNVAPSDALSEPVPNEAAGQIGPLHVRQDLWNAFNSLSGSWLYDPTLDRAFRNDVGAAQPGIISIPAGAPRVRESMRAFAALQDREVQARLLSVVEAEGGLFQFNNIARLNGLQRNWSRFHIDRIVAAIRSWASTNNVHPQDIVTPYHKPSIELTHQPAPAGNGRFGWGESGLSRLVGRPCVSDWLRSLGF